MNYTDNIVLADGDIVRGGQSVGSYTTYREAQHAVDYLADQKFPVEYTEIVGRDLSFVERVTGRWTTGRAVLAMHVPAMFRAHVATAPTVRGVAPSALPRGGVSLPRGYSAAASAFS